MPYSWPLIPDPPPTPPAPVLTPSSSPATTSRTPDFLGTGLLQPFRRDLKNDFAFASGLALVHACVSQVLSVQADSGDGLVQGEMPWRPEFGSKLYLLRFKKGRVLNAFAEVYVREALTRWEPRVIVTSCTASFDDAARVLTIVLVYDVISKNVPGNRVIFPGVEQTLELPVAA